MNLDTGAPDNIQDWLSTQNSGHWFCWTHPTKRTYEYLEIIDNKFPKPTEEECINGLAAMVLEHEKTQYQRDRVKAYPSWNNQLDMQYHDLVDGTTTWKDTVQAVKDKYPKS